MKCGLCRACDDNGEGCFVFSVAIFKALNRFVVRKMLCCGLLCSWYLEGTECGCVERDASNDVALGHRDVRNVAGKVAHTDCYLLERDAFERQVGRKGATARVCSDELPFRSCTLPAGLEYLAWGVNATSLADVLYDADICALTYTFGFTR